MANQIVQQVAVNWHGSQNLVTDLQRAVALATKLDALRRNQSGFGGSGGGGGTSASRSLYDAGRQARRHEGMLEKAARKAEELDTQRAAKALRGHYKLIQHVGDFQRRLDMRRLQDELKHEEEVARRRADRNLQERNVDEKEHRRTRMFQYAGGAATGLAAYGAGLANPFAMERLQQATRDFAAVVGRGFVPVIKKMTENVRSLADTYNEMPETAKQGVTGAVEGLIAYATLRTAANYIPGASVGGRAGMFAKRAVLPIAAAVAINEGMKDPNDPYGGPIEKGLGSGWKGLKFMVRNTLGELAPWMSREEIHKANRIASLEEKEKYGVATAEQRRELMELRLGRNNAGGGSRNAFLNQFGAIDLSHTSFGAAGLQTGYTDTLEFLKQLRADAFKNAMLGGVSPQEQTAANTQKLVELFSRWLPEQARQAGIVPAGNAAATTEPNMFQWLGQLVDRGTMGKGAPQG